MSIMFLLPSLLMFVVDVDDDVDVDVNIDADVANVHFFCFTLFPPPLL